MKNIQTRLFLFVKRFLTLTGTPYREIPYGLLDIYCPTSTKGWFGSVVQGYEKFSLVFLPEMLSTYPDAELITPGSFRLHWLVDGLERGMVTRQIVLYDFSIRDAQKRIIELSSFNDFEFQKHHLNWEPHLLANIKTAFIYDTERTEKFLSPCLSLVTGRVYPDVLSRLLTQNMTAKIGHRKIASKKIKIKEGYRLITEYVEEQLRREHMDQIAESRRKIQSEQAILAEYFSQQDDLKQYELHLMELLWRLRPQIVVRLINAALLYLPVVYYQINTRDNRQKLLRYHPVPDILEHCRPH